jgi:hypothetical protein
VYSIRPVRLAEEVPLNTSKEHKIMRGGGIVHASVIPVIGP